MVASDSVREHVAAARQVTGAWLVGLLALALLCYTALRVGGTAPELGSGLVAVVSLGYATHYTRQHRRVRRHTRN
jgi:CHASE2 domain-containing sensor protein